MALESVHSIRFLYQHFLSGITKKSLNAFYHACSYAKADYSRFMNVTVRTTLHLIPNLLKTQPVFLCIDETMVTKFGTKFENVSKLFDHAAHNGSNYLNGHCFVSLMLCIPVWKHDKISYLAVPLGYRMWQKRKTCKTRTKTLHRWRFCTVRWKDWWLLYGSTPCTYKSFRSQRSPRVCHINHKRWRCKTLVFQYGFTWTSGDFLRMAWKSSIKSDWQWLDAVYTIIFIFIQMEYPSELLWAENILVFMQLYGTKLQRNRNDGKSYQHQLLCNETAALCRQWICWLV